MRAFRFLGFCCRVSLLGLALLAFASVAEAARNPEPLFVNASTSPGAGSAQGTPAVASGASAGQAIGNALGRGVRTSKEVRINPAALFAPEVLLSINNTDVLVRRTRIEQQVGDTVTWVGRFGPGDEGQLIFTRHRGRFAGIIQTGDQRFRIQSGAGQSVRLEELDPPAFAEDNGAAPVPQGMASAISQALAPSASPAAGSNSTDPTQVAAAATSSVVTHTLLVVYTQSACAVAAGCAQVEAEIINKVALTNTVYANSGVNIHLELIGMQEVGYTGGDPYAALTALQDTRDGVLDEVHALRDAINADLVSMIIDIDQSQFPICGLAYRQVDPLEIYRTLAFGVVDFEDSICSEYTFTHELGHNQGARHDRVTEETPDANGNTQPIAADEYGFGYRRCNDATAENVGRPFFRTVMAYFCSGATNRAPNFSNPDVLYAGVPTGIDPAVNPAIAAHAARRLNDGAAAVAAYRDGASPPGTPGSLQVTVDAAPSATLNWVDNASNETGFLIQRLAEQAASWVVVATLPADTTAFSDSTVLYGSTYVYRVAAINAAGTSGYSNRVTVSTPAAPPAAQVPSMPLPLLAGLGGLVCWVAARRRSGVPSCLRRLPRV